MRRWNARISLSILVLMTVHASAGAFKLTGVFPGGSAVLKALSWLMLGLVAVHGCLGIKLTFDTWRAHRKSGTSYFRENALFHIRRISGFAMVLLIAYHVMIFLGRGGGSYRLVPFEGVQLAAMLLLAAALVIHVASNIRPLIVALGAGSARRFALDILLILSIVLLFCAGAFIVYYLRWNVFWK